MVVFATELSDKVGKAVATAYRKAVGALVKYFPSDELDFEAINESNLRDWVVAMLLDNLTVVTVKYYLENIAAIYNKAVKAGLAVKTDAFSVLLTQLSSVEVLGWDIDADKDLKLLNELAIGTKPYPPGLTYYVDLFMFSVFNMGMSVEDMLKLSATDTEKMCRQARIIAQKYISPRRNRVFPRGNAADVERKISVALHYLGFDNKVASSVSDFSGVVWIQAALRLGIPVVVVRSIIARVSSGMAAIAMSEEAVEVSASEKAELAERVAESIVSNPRRWHVMKLRQGVVFDKVKDTLKLAGFRFPTFFYPCEEMAKRIGKKLVYKEQAIIPDIVFFKCTDSDVLPMFRIIGGLAWCYRNDRSGSYAVVPQREMDRFQQMIGIFTPEFDLMPLGTNRIEPGCWVRITGGAMDGYEGEVCMPAGGEGKVNADGTRSRVFRLNLFGNNGVEWMVDIDERMMEVIPAPPRHI